MMTFPYWIELGPIRLHPHPFFEVIAYVIGFRIYRGLRRRRGDAVADTARWAVIAAAALGAAAGSKILALANDPLRTWQHLDDPMYLLGGKTIVGGILGGWFAVEWVKRRIGVTRSTGDLFAIPLAIGIAIGRIGCFLTGLDDHTHGTPTDLPWGVDFGDGATRHPTQLYEIGFLATLALWLARRSGELTEGAMFRGFVFGYFAWRLFVDCWKPDRALFGLSGIQWVCAGTLAWMLWRRFR